jgi:hypothetical protein
MDLARIQEALRREKLDGWLFFDHHERDPLAYAVLGFKPKRHVTRRWYYLIPAQSCSIRAGRNNMRNSPLCSKARSGSPCSIRRAAPCLM